MTIDELIAALEKAEGPSSEIDADIGLTAAGWEPWLSKLPPFTSSLDAALTLVPDGCDWFVSSEFNGKQWFATVTSGDRLNHFVARESRASPAIAICIAALKARRNA